MLDKWDFRRKFCTAAYFKINEVRKFQTIKFLGLAIALAPFPTCKRLWAHTYQMLGVTEANRGELRKMIAGVDGIRLDYLDLSSQTLGLKSDLPEFKERKKLTSLVRRLPGVKIAHLIKNPPDFIKEHAAAAGSGSGDAQSEPSSDKFIGEEQEPTQPKKPPLELDPKALKSPNSLGAKSNSPANKSVRGPNDPPPSYPE